MSADSTVYKYFSTNSTIYNGANQIYLASLSAGSDAATLTIKDIGFGVGGTTICVLKAATGTTESVMFPKPLSVKFGIQVTLTGTAPSGFVATDGAYTSTSTSSSTTTTSTSTTTTSTSTTTTSTTTS
jgi:hypothetical protein